MRRLLLAIALAVIALAPAAAEQPQYFAIRNARVVPVSGPVIETGTVVIHNGLISAVGANATIPAAALVIDGKGFTVYPGLIDALSTIGLPEGAAATATASRFGAPGTPAPSPAPAVAGPSEASRPAQGPEDRPQTTPWIHAADQISASDRRIEAARNAGFTTALVAPSRGIFTGFSSLVNLAGERPGEMVVKSPVSLHLTFPGGGFGGGSGFPASLFGTIAYVKQTLLDARHYQQAWAGYNGGKRGRRRPAYDRALEHLQPAVAGRVPLFLPAQTEVEIRRYLDLGRELGAPFLLYGAQQGYRVAPLLAESKVPVLVSSKWPERSRDPDPELEESLRTLRHRDRASSTPAALHKAGARFAFYSDGAATPRDVLRNVKKAIDAGLPADAALRAMTLAPAEILGVADTLGSIEPGKVANLVVADGDLFAERTKIKYVFVDGRKFTVPEEEARPEGPAGVSATGAWNLTIDMHDGPLEATATLRQDGASLTGSVTSRFGSNDVTEGSVSGSEVRFRLNVNIGGRSVDVSFRGTISGSNIKGTMAAPNMAPANFTGARSPGLEFD